MRSIASAFRIALRAHEDATTNLFCRRALAGEEDGYLRQRGKITMATQKRHDLDTVEEGKRHIQTTSLSRSLRRRSTERSPFKACF
jgi:hypothetical protein